MSRTYRKKPYQWRCNEPLIDWYVREDEIEWADVESAHIDHMYGSWSRFDYYTIRYKANSKTGKKKLALGRRDTVFRFKEPGPSWWRKLTAQRPYRRASKMALLKYIKLGAETFHTDYEPVIESKPKLDYWT